MGRPLGDRTFWTFGYYPTKYARKELRVVPKLYTGRYVAGIAAQRSAAETGCEVTPPLRVKVEIPIGVRR